MVRPTGIELVSSAPQADTLSIELWALKSDFSDADYQLHNYFNIFVLTFQFFLQKCFVFFFSHRNYSLLYIYYIIFSPDISAQTAIIKLWKTIIPELTYTIKNYKKW